MKERFCRNLTPVDQRAFQGFTDRETVIFVFSATEKKSVVVAIPSENISESDVLAQIQSITFTSPKKQLEVKVAGPSEPSEKIKRLLHRNNFTVATYSIRETQKFNFIYYPDTGRLRLEKELSSATELKTTPLAITKVLIIDDSPTIQKLLTSIFSSDPQIKVVGTVGNPLLAEKAIQELKPDVLTLDIHMPEMSGIDLLKRINPKYQLPTVMITSVSREEGPLVLEALESGAIDYLQKPSLNEVANVQYIMIEKVKMAAASKKKRQVSSPTIQYNTSVLQLTPEQCRQSIIAIGSSTGGTEALRELLTRLPDQIPPIVIVQHIPAVFSEALAKRLNDLCTFTVAEAKDGDLLKPNQVLIAPGGRQMDLISAGRKKYQVRITDTPPVNRHKPSVDVLFDSVAKLAGADAFGVILTGMGADGARGLLQMKNKGARTIAQDEATSVVYGMPREAAKLGAAEEIVPLDAIAAKLVHWVSLHKKTAA